MRGGGHGAGLVSVPAPPSPESSPRQGPPHIAATTPQQQTNNVNTATQQMEQLSFLSGPGAPISTSRNPQLSAHASTPGPASSSSASLLDDLWSTPSTPQPYGSAPQSTAANSLANDNSGHNNASAASGVAPPPAFDFMAEFSQLAQRERKGSNPQQNNSGSSNSIDSNYDNYRNNDSNNNNTGNNGVWGGGGSLI